MSNTPSEGKKGNGDLSYHLHRLLESGEAEIDARTQAARTIFRATKGHIEDVLSDDLLPRFLAAYEGTDNLGLRSELASILSYRWSTREEVQQLMRCSIDAQDTPPQILGSFILWLRSRLEDVPSSSQDPGIREIVANAHELLARGKGEPVDALTNYAVLLLKTWGIAAYAHEQGIERVDTDFWLKTLIACHNADSNEFRAMSSHLRSLVGEERLQAWIDGLEDIYLIHRRSDPWLAMNALRAQSFLEGRSAKAIARELYEMGLEDEKDDESEGYEDDADPLDLLFPPKPPTLSPEEEDQLAEQVRAQSHSPASLLTEIMREKQYVFLDVRTDEAIRKLPDIVRELEKEAHLSHIALNIPPQCAEDFHRFLAGEDPPELQHALYGNHKFADSNYKEMADCYRNALREVDAIEGVEWMFVGTPPGIDTAGELALDQHTRNLAQVRRTDPQARILVFVEALIGFHGPTSRIHLTNVEDDSKDLSLPRQLADEIGEERVACVMTLDTGDRFDQYQPGKDEIGEFCHRYGIITSFGTRVADTPLANKPFNREVFRNTYGEAWDGLIVFVPKDDDDDRERMAEPRPSHGKTLSPQQVLA